MNFSFIDDPRWNELDTNSKQQMLAVAFNKEVASDERWNSLDQDSRKAMAQTYFQKANEYQNSQNIQESPGIFETIGKGLAHGTLGLAESIGTGTEYLGERLNSEGLADVGRTTKKYWGEKAQGFLPSDDIYGKNVVDNPEILKNTEWWLYNISDMVPVLASSLIPGAIATKGLQAATAIPKLAKIGGMVAGGFTGGAIEGTQTYNAVLEKGGTEEEAARAGELMTLGSGVLNALSVGKILSKAGVGFKGKVIKHLGAGAWEGISEGLEEPTEVFSKYFGAYLAGEELPTDLENQLIESAKDALTVAPIAAVTGSGASVLSGDQFDPTNNKPQTDEINKEIIDNLTNGTPEITPEEELSSEITDSQQRKAQNVQKANLILQQRKANQEKINAVNIEPQEEILEPIKDNIEVAQPDQTQQPETSKYSGEERYTQNFLDMGMQENQAKVSSQSLVRSFTDPEEAKAILHPNNKFNREVWQKETGIILPETIKGTKETIDKYLGDSKIESGKDRSKLVENLEKKAREDELKENTTEKEKDIQSPEQKLYDIEAARVAKEQEEQERIKQEYLQAEQEIKDKKEQAVSTPNFSQGQSVSWKTKTGKEFSGTIIKENPTNLFVKNENGKNVWVTKKGVVGSEGEKDVILKESVKQVHDHTNTQVQIPDKEATAIKEFALKIPEDELYTESNDDSYGRENEPHITVKYGLETNDPKDVAKIVKTHPPIKAKMGKVSIFENKKYDVVKVEVESPELNTLNKKIANEAKIDLPDGETFEYSPHATIAYVKAGQGKKYVGDNTFSGKEIIFNEITVSTKDGKQHQIKLEGSSQSQEISTKKTDESKAEEAQPEQTAKIEKEEVKNSEKKEVKTVEDFENIKKDIYKGDVTPEQLKAGFNSLLENKEQIVAELSKLPKDSKKKEAKTLLSMLGGMARYRYKSENKDAVVKAVYQGMLDTFNLSSSLSYDPFQKDGFINALREKIKSTTQEDIDEYAAKIKKNTEEYIEKRKRILDAVDNPQTLEDFEKFFKYAKDPTLTPEQQERYDALKSDSLNEKQKAEIEKKSTLKAVEANTDFELIEGVHTKKGHDIFTVKMTERVDKETFRDLRSKAKQLGGYYSMYRGNGATPGFVFTEKSQAEKFMSLKDNDVSIKEEVETKTSNKEKLQIARLKAMAEKAEAKGKEKLNQDRLTNTSKRASQAASAEADARETIAFAKTLKQIVTGIENGKVKYLSGIKNQTQLTALFRIFTEARNKANSEKDLDNLAYDKREAIRKRLPEYSDIIHASLPELTSSGNIFNSFLNDVEAAKISGTKLLVNRLRSLIPKDDYKSIDFSNWKREEDLRAILKKAKDYNKNKVYSNQINLSWYIEEQIQNRDRLARMGIKTDEQVRSALRELSTLEVQTEKEDPIKTKERELIGNKNIGIDFFPTPKTIANDLVERAEIKEGDKILEPSAGKGDIADTIKEFHPGNELSTVEMSGTLREFLELKGHNVVDHDFLEHQGEYDKIIMNPPFSKGRDVDHVKHAYSLLKPGGKIVAIMGEHPFFANDKKSVEFREWLSDKGFDEKLPEGSFKGKDAFNQTGVNSRVVEIEKADNTKYSTTTDTSPGKGLSLKDIQSRFKNQTVTINQKDNSIIVRLKNGLSLKIKQLHHISEQEYRFVVETGKMSQNGVILGKYKNNEIFLNKNLASNFTRDHELYHFLSDNNIITKADQLILNGKMKALQKKDQLNFHINTSENKKLAKEENEANMFAQLVQEREKYGNTPIGRMIQRVMDFVDSLVYIARLSAMKITGKDTSSLKSDRELMNDGNKLADEVLSGKIFERNATESEIKQYLKKLNKSLSLHQKYLGRYEAMKNISISDETRAKYKNTTSESPVARPKRDIPVIIGRIKSIQDAIKQVEEVAYSTTAPQWYSQMQQVLEQKLNNASANQIRLQLKSWAKKGLFKQEELEWSGLDEWLGAQEGKVTKQEVLDYLEANNVRVEEVVKNKEGIEELNIGFLEEIFDVAYSDGYRMEDIDDAIEYTNTNRLNAEYTPEQVLNAWERYEEYQNNKDNISEDTTKFSQYQLEGAENYKEVLLTLPNKLESQYQDGLISKSEKLASEYSSSHYDEPNIIAHMRIGERTIDGKKAMHVSEIQSDWHQEGRKKGYQGDKPELTKQYGISIDGGEPNIFFNTEQEAKERIEKIKDNFDKLEIVEVEREVTKGVRVTKVPNAPFKKTWPMLAIKRLVRMAAEQNFDMIVFDTGEIQADRYDLSSQVDKIVVAPDEKSYKRVALQLSGSNTVITMGVDKKGIIQRASAEAEIYRGKPLEDVIGKEITKRVMETDRATLSGQDLKVGGEGMKGFYDQILPSEINKFFNKKAWGNAKVELNGVVTNIPPNTVSGVHIFNNKDGFSLAIENLETDKKEYWSGEEWSDDITNAFIFDFEGEAKKAIPDINGKNVALHSLPITPEMKQKALNQGMPLFQTSSDLKDFEEQESTLLQKASDMIIGNWKHRKDKGSSGKEDISPIAHILQSTMYNAEKVGGAYKRLWDVIRKKDDYKKIAQRKLWFEGDESLLEGLKTFTKQFKDEYKKLSDYLYKKDINAEGFIVKEDNGKFKILDWKIDKNTGKRLELNEEFETEEEAWEKAIFIEANESGLSEKGQDALIRFRKMSHNLYHHYAKGMQDTIDAYERAGKPVPKITTQTGDGTTKIDLYAAMKKMGDLRGHYFPRLRNSGQYRVMGFKSGVAKQMKFFDLKVSANAYMSELERKGFKTEIEKVGKLSEDLFQSLEPLLAQQQILNKALENISNKDKIRILEDMNIKGEWRDNDFILTGYGIKANTETFVRHLGGKYKERWKSNTYSPEIVFGNIEEGTNPDEFEQKITNAILHSGGLEVDMDLAFAQAMVKQYDIVLKERGARARMISRSDAKGIHVTQGYEKDALIAITQAMQAAAGSEAKSIVAKEGIAAIMGRDKEWKDFKEQHQEEATQELQKKLDKLDITTPEQKALKEKAIQELIDVRNKLGDIKDPSPDFIIKSQRKIKKLNKQIKDLTRWSDIKEAQEIKAQLVQAKQDVYKNYLDMVEDRKIDAKVQNRTYKEATATLKDILKNEEFADRVVGTLKGLAVWQYLGLRVSSAAVNVTNMGLGVPAAINGETKNQVSISKAIKFVGRGMKNYALHRAGKLSGEQKQIYDEIRERGWDDPQLNREAFDVLASKWGKGWNFALEKSMWMFGKTEEMNRAATIAGAYFSMKEFNKGKWDHEAMMQKARDISDKAHGSYGVANRPYQMRGDNLAARTLQMTYVFQTFTHNYLQEMYRLGFDQKQYKAALYMALAPAIFGVGATVPMGVAKAISKVLGGDDPEEALIDFAEQSFGGGDIARNGVMGAFDHGINLRGSLATRFGAPSTFADLFGAPGSVVSDIWQGGKNISKGYYVEGFEKIAPTAIGNISKGIRETTQGVTTKSGTPVFWGEEQLKGDSIDMIIRMFSFNPTNLSKKKEIQWAEYSKQKKYQAIKSDIYKKLKKFYSKPSYKRNRSELIKIKADIRDFNIELKNKNISRIVPLITDKSIKNVLRRTTKAPKRERLRNKE